MAAAGDTRPGDWDELDEAIQQAMNGVIAKLDAATDFDACLADVYRRAERLTGEEL